MTEASKKRGRKKVTLASVEFDKVTMTMGFEHRGRVILETFGGSEVYAVKLPNTDDEWSSGALSPETVRLSLTRPCALDDGSVYALVSSQGQRRRIASVDLDTATFTDVAQPAEWQSELKDLLAFRGSAIAIGAWADRAQHGYDGVVLATGERLAVPRENPQRPSYEIQVYPFAGAVRASLVLADGAAFLWKGDTIERIPLQSSIRCFDFGQRDRSITLDDGRLLLCCGDSADSGTHATAYRSYTIRWFDTDGRTGVFDPSIEYAVCGWAGPDGAMIVHRPEKSTEHLFSIVWTKERVVADVPRAWARFRKFAHDVVYSPTARALVCLQLKKTGARVTAIPWREIEALPRRAL